MLSFLSATGYTWCQLFFWLLQGTRGVTCFICLLQGARGVSCFLSAAATGYTWCQLFFYAKGCTWCQLYFVCYRVHVVSAIFCLLQGKRGVSSILSASGCTWYQLFLSATGCRWCQLFFVCYRIHIVLAVFCLLQGARGVSCVLASPLPAGYRAGAAGWACLGRGQQRGRPSQGQGPGRNMLTSSILSSSLNFSFPLF